MIINLCWTDFCVLIFSIQFPSTRGRNRFTGARLNIAILFFADDLLAVLPFFPLSALVLVKKNSSSFQRRPSFLFPSLPKRSTSIHTTLYFTFFWYILAGRRGLLITYLNPPL